MKLQKLIQQRETITEKIENEIAKLPNYGGECSCEEPGDTVNIVHHGWFDETFTYCTECGGIASGLL